MKYWICFVMLSQCLHQFYQFGKTPYVNTGKWVAHIVVGVIFGYFTYYLWGNLA